MHSHVFEPEVTPIEGEPNGFFVSSSKPGVPDYLVDLEEYDGVGDCECPHHIARIAPKLKEAQALGGHIPMLRCKHVQAALKFRHLQALRAQKEQVPA